MVTLISFIGNFDETVLLSVNDFPPGDYNFVVVVMDNGGSLTTVQPVTISGNMLRDLFFSS